MENIDDQVIGTLEQNETLRDLLRNDLIRNLVSIAIALILGFIVLKASKKIIERLLHNKKTGKVSKSKLRTISSLIYSIIKVIVIFIVITIVLDKVGINTSSIIATAGIGGIAIAFGSQTIIQDFIKGIFIVLDDQIRVGDWIIAAGAEGEVEELNLRNTHIRDFDGSLHIIPNSQISNVQNYNRGNNIAQVYYRLSYEVTLDEAKDIADTVAKKIEADADTKKDVIANFTFFEVNSFDPHSYVVRITAETTEGMVWAVQRKARELIKEEMEKRNLRASLVEYDKNEEV